MVASVTNTPNTPNFINTSTSPGAFNVINPDIADSSEIRPIHAMDKVTQEQMYNPGLYALPELIGTPTYKRKNSGGFLGFLGRLVVFAALIAGAGVAARKWIGPIRDMYIAEKLPEPVTLKTKIKYGIAKFGDWVDTSVKDFFKKRDKAPDTAVETEK